jgi:hypothetical protein
MIWKWSWPAYDICLAAGRGYFPFHCQPQRSVATSRLVLQYPAHSSRQPASLLGPPALCSTSTVVLCNAAASTIAGLSNYLTALYRSLIFILQRHESGLLTCPDLNLQMICRSLLEAFPNPVPLLGPSQHRSVIVSS